MNGTTLMNTAAVAVERLGSDSATPSEADSPASPPGNQPAPESSSFTPVLTSAPGVLDDLIYDPHDAPG